MTSLSLTEGRRSGRSVQLDWVIFKSLLVGYFSLDVNSLVWTLLLEKSKQGWGLSSMFLLNPQTTWGTFGNIVQRDGQASSLCASAWLAWSGLGSIWSKVEKIKKTLFYETKLNMLKWKMVSTSLFLPQNTKVAVGSETRECRRKEARPALLELMTHPSCSVSAPQSQFLHSSGELHVKGLQWVTVQGNSTENTVKKVSLGHEI